MPGCWGAKFSEDCLESPVVIELSAVYGAAQQADNP